MDLKSIYRFLSPRYQKLFNEYPVEFRPRYGHGKPANAGLQALIEANRAEYKDRLSFILSLKDPIQQIRPAEKESDPAQPAWNNGFLPGLDIAALYAFMKFFSPRLYVEIGSGNSTKVARKAIRDFGLATKICSIDPFPRAEIDSLADKVIRQPLESMADLSFVDELQPNDILFIDNSHRSFPNSDVTVCFLELLPRLRPGVVVHIHDIYLPYDYPQFMCDRFYNEQYLLACYLLGGTQVKTIMPNYFVSEDKELSGLLAPLWEHLNLQGVERHGGSYWMVRC
ncbi:MAG: class I SAM-dependent methyltransferase [Bacteroidota bacterium]